MIWITALACSLYVAWSLLDRRSENRRIEQAEQAKRIETDRQIIEKLGGRELKILNFYANPPVLSKGRKGSLCYGVSNAAKVRIEPDVEPIRPALSHCVEIAPSRSTEYSLVAEDGAGKTLRQSVSVRLE